MIKYHTVYISPPGFVLYSACLLIGGSLTQLGQAVFLLVALVGLTLGMYQSKIARRVESTDDM